MNSPRSAHGLGRALPGAALLTALLLGCGGSHPAPPVDRVLVVGYASTGIQVGDSIPNQALLWVDGKATPLSPGSPSFALGLALSGSTVHAVGQDIGPDGLPRPLHWVDGRPQALPTGPLGDAYPTCILVSGDTVTIGGRVGISDTSAPACLWVNGVLSPLADELGQWSRVEALAMEGKLLRGVGSRGERLPVEPNTTWITGVPMMWGPEGATHLGGSLDGGQATALQIRGDATFAAGYQFHWVPADFAKRPAPADAAAPLCPTMAPESLQAFRKPLALTGGSTPAIATLWQNGIPSELSDGQLWAQATGVSLTDQETFVSGLQQVNAYYDAAVYWRNGRRVDLTQGRSEARATGIAVMAGDVYACGYEVLNGVCVATVWKNGEPIRLGDGVNDSFAKGIVVQRAW